MAQLGNWNVAGMTIGTLGTGASAPAPAPTVETQGQRPTPLPSGQDPGEQQAPTVNPFNQVLTQ
jgi:hypothetical protein